MLSIDRKKFAKTITGRCFIDTKNSAGCHLWLKPQYVARMFTASSIFKRYLLVVTIILKTWCCVVAIYITSNVKLTNDYNYWRWYVSVVISIAPIVLLCVQFFRIMDLVEIIYDVKWNQWIWCIKIIQSTSYYLEMMKKFDSKKNKHKKLLKCSLYEHLFDDDIDDDDFGHWSPDPIIFTFAGNFMENCVVSW